MVPEYRFALSYTFIIRIHFLFPIVYNYTNVSTFRYNY